MNIDTTEFLYICENSTKEFQPVDLVNDPIHDTICTMETMSIMHDIFGHCVVADWEPCFNGVRK